MKKYSKISKIFLGMIITMNLFYLQYPVYSNGVGTSQPFYCDPKDGNSSLIDINDYVYVRVHNPCAYLSGSIFKKYNGILITSEIEIINNSIFSGKAKNILSAKDNLNQNVLNCFGYSKHLISISPANLKEFNIHINFMLHKSNRIKEFIFLLQNDAVLAPFSFAPAQLAVVQTITKITDALLNTLWSDYSKTEENLLQFTKTFDLNIDKPGFYIIVGSFDKSNPLPGPTDNVGFDLKTMSPVINEKPAQNYSFIIIELGRISNKNFEEGRGSLWWKKLTESKSMANAAAFDQTLSDTQRKNKFDKCNELIVEADILLQDDVRFSTRDRDAYIKDARKSLFELGMKIAVFINNRQDLYREIGIQGEEEVNEALEAHMKGVENSLRILENSTKIEVNLLRIQRTILEEQFKLKKEELDTELKNINELQNNLDDLKIENYLENDLESKIKTIEKSLNEIENTLSEY